jgi:hypothetical protein
MPHAMSFIWNAVSYHILTTSTSPVFICLPLNRRCEHDAERHERQRRGQLRRLFLKGQRAGQGEGERGVLSDSQRSDKEVETCTASDALSERIAAKKRWYKQQSDHTTAGRTY